jgi:hypothetical protein
MAKDFGVKTIEMMHIIINQDFQHQLSSMTWKIFWSLSNRKAMSFFKFDMLGQRTGYTVFQKACQYREWGWQM